MSACSLQKELLQLSVVRKEFADPQRQICLLTLTSADASPLPPFVPGQYLPLRLTINDPRHNRAQSVLRCYSLCNRPGLDYWQIAIKRLSPPANSPALPSGLASSFLHRIRVGEILTAKMPCGTFTLQETQKPLLLIAGGIGITPMLSMLDQLYASNDPRPVQLFHAVRNSKHRVASSFLETLRQNHPPFRLHLCFSQPLREDRPGYDFHSSGHLSLAHLQHYAHLGNSQIYLCGPTAMMQKLLNELQSIGFPEQQIHYEAFSALPLQRFSPPELATHAAQEITLALSQRKFVWHPHHTSLLEAAEEQGIILDFGCRAGNCGVCELPLLQGEVTHHPLAFNQAQPGHCLPCIAIPKSAIVLQA
ncbi:2Fe-2S iron-sulfur cluster-binding protein [Candidatus Magnetaquicoccus inordinatus]|uniref:2Fe-2S iron-sulfur cluster-binding protein n=1 Tax=Candidatus Magnetaquicoccus inordinatus TaxID=2496818 RepID=UPI00102AD5DD|nr:2Fe-2S iron-sulfur cluster-binding protein [Candidatus Magnetaquicoccus inordinatus]